MSATMRIRNVRFICRYLDGEIASAASLALVPAAKAIEQLACPAAGHLCERSIIY